MVIGAVAVAGHGYVRATTDVDVVPADARTNLERLEAALQALDAQPWLPPGFPARAPARVDLGLLETGRNFALITRFGEIDVMQDVPGAPPYEELRAGAIDAQIELDLVVPICGYSHLTSMKEATGRARTQLDLDELRALSPEEG